MTVLETGVTAMTMTKADTEAAQSLRILLGRNVRRLREARMLSQGGLAARIPGWEQAMVSDVECGKRDLKISSLTKLAVALGVTEGHLLQ